MELNEGDYIFFGACGMYVSSLLMGLSINDFSFAKEIINFVVILGISGAGYGEFLRKSKLEKRKNESRN